MTAPRLDETPFIYTAATSCVVSIAIIVEREEAEHAYKMQRPVYFISEFTRSGHTQQPSSAIMITSTISVVFVSTVVFGLLTKPLIRLLIPPRHLSREPSSISEPSSPKSFFEQLAANSPGHLDLENGTSLRRPTSLHHFWRKFDDGFMRPVFGGRGFVPFVPGSPTERSLPLLPGNEN